MARWICPKCNAVMAVKNSFVGVEKPCASCGQASIITDSDAPSGEAVSSNTNLIDLSSVATSPQPPKLPPRDIELSFPVTGLSQSGATVPLLVIVGRVLIAVSTLLYTVVMVVQMSQQAPLGLTIAMQWQLHAGVYGTMFTSWVIVEIAAEVYRCRLRLDQLARASEKR